MSSTMHRLMANRAPGNTKAHQHVPTPRYEQVRPLPKASHKTPSVRDLIMQKLNGSEAQPGTVDLTGNQQ